MAGVFLLLAAFSVRFVIDRTEVTLRHELVSRKII